MNTIEQAAKRLEQLRRAGVDIGQPALGDVTPPAAEPAAPRAEAAPNAAPQTITISLVDAYPPAANTHPSLNDPQSGAGRRSRNVQLDLLRMSRAGLLVPGNPRSQLEEEFRIIKRPLLENVRGQTAVRPHRANLIMVTSALPAEGKTQTAINLAISIAMELDHTVLLVEADVLRPSALERMGVQSTHGLLDLLDGKQTDLADVLLKTNIPKLTVLPAGTARSRSTELLASDAMNALLEELASKYSDRVIVFDTPPLLPTTESRVLASNMGQVVMVVEASKTPISTVKQAFTTVEEHPVVLTMLNKYRGPKSNNVYGYYAP
jgi:protein-tyrosine kinase